MKYLARLSLFFAVLCLPAVALASVMDPGGLPFNPEDFSALAQVLLEKMLSRDFVGLGAAVVIAATFFGGKLLAPRVAFFATGNGKVLLAIGTSVLFGLGNLFIATPLAGITASLVLQVLVTACLNAALGVGAFRVGQVAFARKQAEEAGAAAVQAALGSRPTDEAIAEALQRGGQ